MAMKGAHLGFASIFFEIPVQMPSIYRGFGLIISCACRALSPSFLIRHGFNFVWFPLGFRSVTALPTRSVIRCVVGDDSVLGRSLAAREGGRSRLSWASGEGFIPWPIEKWKRLFNFQIFSKF
jgi:hypothetical protein